MDETQRVAPARRAPEQGAVGNLISRGSVYGLATGLQLGASILVLPAVTRLMTATDYGVVAVAIVVQMLIGTVAGAGLAELMPRTFHHPDAGREIGPALVTTSCALGVAVALVAELTGPLWSEAALGLHYGGALRVAVWGVVPTTVLTTTQSIFRAENRVYRFLVSVAIAAAGGQALGLVLLLAVERRPLEYLVGTVAGTAAGAAFGAVSTGARRPDRADRRRIRGVLAISSPVIAHGLALYVLWAGDRSVISRLRGSDAAGRYQVAYLVGGLAVLLVSAIYNAWSPIVFGARAETRWHVLAETTAAVFQVVAGFAAICAVVAPLGLLALAPASYDPLGLVRVSAVIAASALPFAAYCAVVQVVVWHGKTRTLALATLAAAAVNIGLNLVLLPPLGLVGSALATLLSYGLLAFLVGARARTLADVQWPVRTVFVSVAAAALVVASAALAPTTVPWLAVRAVAAVGLAAWLALQSTRLRRRAVHEAAPA